MKLRTEEDIMNTRIKTREEAFDQIAKNLHDNISLSLTLAKLNLNTLDYPIGETSKLKLRTTIHLLSDTIKNLSNLSLSLNGESVLQNGLVNAITWELERIQQSEPFQIFFKVDGEPIYLHTNTELTIFRILQEVINNIIKHANASEVNINLQFSPLYINLKINDNGRGFNPNNVDCHFHSGLLNIKSRIQSVSGKMELTSVAMKGTTFQFKIPL